MSKTDHWKLPAFARDLLSLIPPEYVLYLGQDSISLIRLKRAAEFEIVYSKDLPGAVSACEIADFCRDMRKSGAYYGQPLTAVINRSEVYTYAKRMNNRESVGVLERMRFLQQDHIDLQTCMFQKEEDRVFVAQGLDKDLLRCLREELDTSEMNVEQLVSLPAILIRSMLNSQGKVNSIGLYQLPGGSTASLIQDAGGNIVFYTIGTGTSHGSLPAVANKLQETFFDEAASVDISVYSLPSSGASSPGQQPLAKALRRSVRSARKLGSLGCKTSRSRFAVAARTAINSARLLMLVLGAAFFLSALTAGISGLAALSDDDLIEDYQEHYGAKLALEQTRDSLLTVQRQVSGERRPTRNLAPVVSAFCQRKFNPLALTRIYMSNVSAESTFIEIGGSAENEDVIFKYIDAIGPYVVPYRLTMSSMQPEIRNMRGTADTTITFKLRMIAD